MLGVDGDRPLFASVIGVVSIPCEGDGTECLALVRLSRASPPLAPAVTISIALSLLELRPSIQSSALESGSRVFSLFHLGTRGVAPKT